ncbi:FG-GAP repeat protein, partial [Streptomyces ipomoeae]
LLPLSGVTPVRTRAAHASDAATPYDFNGDGYADLAVGAPYESSASGAVTVLYGSAQGLTTTNARTLTQSTSGVPGSSESGDHFGTRVLLTDTTKDGRADLTIGGPGEDTNDGAVWWLKSATTSGAKSFGPTTVGVSASGSPAFGAILGG